MQMDLFNPSEGGHPASPKAISLVEPDAAALPAESYSYHNGDKFQGGFGPTQLLTADYWTLRARSAELFKTNLYARGLIRRLVQNEINAGLHLESMPEAGILGLNEDDAETWAESVETRWELWGKNAGICDRRGRQMFGEFQQSARAEALVSGDVLCVNNQDPITGLPQTKLIPGGQVQQPWRSKVRRGHECVHGVELDADARHVAFWLVDKDGKERRLPAIGKRSGRKLAWLYYGTDKRYDDVRGPPMLSLVLQSLKEIDRYRDATMRKAVVNSILAMFIKRDQPARKTSLSTGAVKRGTDSVVGEDGKKRSFKVADFVPGVFIEGLEPGEEPHAFANNGVDEKFSDFEAAMLRAVAWANSVPPEILFLSFNKSFSASQAGINEFTLYLNPVRTSFGAQCCAPYFEEWLLSEVRNGNIAAPGLLEASRDRRLWDIYGAWVNSDWAGNIKPSTDPVKMTKAKILQVDAGFITAARATRELTGMKHSRVMRHRRREALAMQEVNSILEPPEPPATEQHKPKPSQAPTKSAQLVVLPTTEDRNR